jgi:catechol 2,3-dioxygenase-like lactoylglutathione lyase family enzyme
MGSAQPATPSLVLEGVTLDCSDPRRLAQFYRQLLGSTETREDSDSWVTITEPTNQLSISFQKANHYRPPVWPPEPDRPQMMLHLEIRVSDLPEACAKAESLGATQLAHQPQPNVRVYADPAGHPFCLFV